MAGRYSDVKDSDNFVAGEAPALATGWRATGPSPARNPPYGGIDRSPTATLSEPDLAYSNCLVEITDCRPGSTVTVTSRRPPLLRRPSQVAVLLSMASVRLAKIWRRTRARAGSALVAQQHSPTHAAGARKGGQRRCILSATPSWPWVTHSEGYSLFRLTRALAISAVSFRAGRSQRPVAWSQRRGAAYFHHSDAARARASNAATPCQNRTGERSYSVSGRRDGGGA